MGKIVGDEVVQLYVRKENSRVNQPICQLKGFERVKNLVPGETREVSFTVKTEDLKYYDVITEAMKLESGIYTFMACASSKDIRQQVSFAIEGDKEQKRNPFEATKAVLYDSSRNCFIHKAVIGHDTKGKICVIPGKPGDKADVVDKERGNKVSCELVYRDFKFEKLPEKLMISVCAVEDGEIYISAGVQDKTAENEIRLPVKKNEDLEFDLKEAELTKEFMKEKGCCEVRIRIVGKVKLMEFWFI